MATPGFLGPNMDRYPATSSKVKSWTRTMKDYLSKRLDCISPETFMLKDEEYEWTLFHALVSIQGVAQKRRRCVFLDLLKQKENGINPHQLLKMTDCGGDTVFHSVVHHPVDGKVLQMMINHIPPKITRSLLQIRNQRGCTPLRRAFEMQKWEHVKILLRECVSCRILPELTGVRHNAIDIGPAKTLLHRAFAHTGQCAANYLRIHLIICRGCQLSKLEEQDSLLVADKHGLTPWWHLIDSNRDDSVIREVIDVLTHYGIDVNSLYTDTESRSNLLQPVYKQCRQGLADFLIRAGVDPEQCNRRGLRPRDRKKVVEEPLATPSESRMDSKDSDCQFSAQPCSQSPQEGLSELVAGMELVSSCEPYQQCRIRRQASMEKEILEFTVPVLVQPVTPVLFDHMQVETAVNTLTRWPEYVNI